MRRGRCCCGYSMGLFFTTARYPTPSPYGRVKVWDSGSVLVFDGSVGPDGTIEVMLPSPDPANYKVEISEIPRCKTATFASVSLQPNSYWPPVRISYREVAGGYAGGWLLKPAAGYGVLSSVDYPQTLPLTLDDSAFGSMSLTGTGSYYYAHGEGSYAGGDYKTFTLGPPAESTWLAKNSCGIANLIQTSKSPIATDSSTGAAVAGVWTPEDGGEFSLAISGTRLGGTAYTQDVYE